MPFTRISTIVKKINILKQPKIILENATRSATSTKHGVILPEPQKVSLGILKVLFTVIPGLLIGAGISKNIANFLEENDLFVPSDDDDDDD